ncbi:MAG TPA: hypothetical protein VF376_11735 [Thermoanaerobaculia bacterium]
MILRPALLAFCVASASAGDEARVADACYGDPSALVREAEDRLQMGPGSDREAREQARQLYRSARRQGASIAELLRAADLAETDGDLEEAGDLLSRAAEMDPSRLAASDLLLLAFRAEGRGRRREAIAEYEELRRRLRTTGDDAAWISARIDQLEVEIEADGIVSPAPPLAPPPEARLALAESQRALASGRLREARGNVELALRLSPSYVEALVTLGALETREKRPSQAIRAYRSALKADPQRFEALVGLAHLLWSAPDRRAKEESLALLDRAVSLRPEVRSLLRTSAARWAEWGDAQRALERLDAYRKGATEAERRETDPLREALTRPVRGEIEEPPEAAAATEAPTAASEHWRMAQVYLQRGDPASIDAALLHLAEAERIDPRFAPAPELASAIYEKRGDRAAAETALRRAVRADPSRASSYERLATLLSRDRARSLEAESVWRQADEAGSTEAAFYLGEAALRRGDRSRARVLLARYRAQSPDGAHAETATRALESLERSRRAWRTGEIALAALGLAAAGAALYRYRLGRTFAGWLAERESAAAAARPLVGRLRHEVLKHGGLVLSDGAAALERDEASPRREAASLLVERIYGAGAAGSEGLIAEAVAALRGIEGLAKESGARLNLRYRDPNFSPVFQGLESLRRVERDLRRIAGAGPGNPDSPRRRRRAAVSVRVAAERFQSVSGPELDRILDRAAGLALRAEWLRDLLSRVAAEKRCTAPVLELLGGWNGGPGSARLAVRITPGDWETIWRNLFANALLAGSREGRAVGRLGLAAESGRDPITGQALVRVTLADDAPGELDGETIRNRPADRGWGVVLELVRRHDGAIRIASPAPLAAGFRKGIVLELPAASA